MAPSSTPAADFWDSPWHVRHAAAVVGGLMAVAFGLHALHPHLPITLPGPPWNGVVIAVPAVLLIAARRLWPTATVLNGLGGIPVALCSVAALALVTIPAAVWPQGELAPPFVAALGFDHAFSTFPVWMALGLVLANLALCVGKRLWPWRRRTAASLLTHVGLLLVIGAAASASGGLERVPIRLPRSGQSVDAPSLGRPLRLREFRLEYWPTTFSLAHLDSAGTVWLERNDEPIVAGAPQTLRGWTVRPVECFAQAAVVDGVPRPFVQPGAGPAVRVHAQRADGDSVEGWLHAPTPFGPELTVTLSPTESLFLTPARPKSHVAIVEILPTASLTDALTVEIRANHPATIGEWRLYPLDYDSARGQATDYVTVEAVRDPAWPFVWVGVLITLAGVAGYAWNAAAEEPDAEAEL